MTLFIDSLLGVYVTFIETKEIKTQDRYRPIEDKIIL